MNSISISSFDYRVTDGMTVRTDQQVYFMDLRGCQSAQSRAPFSGVCVGGRPCPEFTPSASNISATPSRPPWRLCRSVCVSRRARPSARPRRAVSEGPWRLACLLPATRSAVATGGLALGLGRPRCLDPFVDGAAAVGAGAAAGEYMSAAAAAAASRMVQAMACRWCSVKGFGHATATASPGGSSGAWKAGCSIARPEPAVVQSPGAASRVLLVLCFAS